MSRLLLFPVLLFCVQLIQAQLSFTDRTDMLESENFYSGVAIGIADMNGDGLDDIVRLDQGVFLQVDYQSNDCDAYFQSSERYRVQQNSAWNVFIADINNDGWNDVMAGGAFEGIKGLISIPNSEAFTEYDVPDSDFFAQAANFVDIDEDGFLDAFICNDDAASKIFMNNQDGTFSFQEVIDFNTVPASDNSGNYGSVWTDFDSDGDLDLYISKCRQGVEDPTDPRRINALYVNNGNNEFTELADTFGLANNGQSWTADFGDLDGDGDLDCFITNHDIPSVILENQGDTVFVDITSTTGVDPTGTLVQGVLQDLNNDGYLDIITSGTIHDIFLNNQDMTFTQLEDLFDGNQIESFSIGDLNNDGSLDIYAGYALPFTNPSNKPDKVWMNDGNENHSVRFLLKGDSSNANGVGARLELFGSWGKQIREIRAGESYGISLSHTAHFGLGSATVIDSVVIRWPSGIVDVIENPLIDQLNIVHEGGCVYQPLELAGDECRIVCEGDSTMIEAPSEFSNYQWSNGDTSRSITVRTPGVYYVKMVNSAGCAVHTLPVTVLESDTPENLSLSESGNVQLCAGQTFELTAPEVESYQWSNGETGQSIIISQSGSYFATLETTCALFQSDTVFFEFLEVEAPQIENDTLLTAGSGLLVSPVMNTFWYLNETDDEAAFEGDSFVTPEVAETNSFYASIFNTINSDILQVGQENHSGFSFYSGNQFNGGQLFHVLSPIVLDSVTIYTEFPGKRIIEIMNDLGEIVFSSDSIDLEEFETTVYLGAFLDEGMEYSISTNAAQNEALFGSVSPKLYRSDRDVNYPYKIENLISMYSSTFGEEYYYYFYDWKVKEPDLVCESPRVEVFVVVDEQVSVNQVNPVFPGKVFPVPANTKLEIYFPEGMNHNASLQLFSAEGIMIENKQSFDLREQNQVRIDIANLANGMYYLLLKMSDEVYSTKVLIQH